MKIRITLVVDLDEGQWARYNGVEKDDVRDDVRTHVLHVVSSLALLEEADAKVVLAP